MNMIHSMAGGQLRTHENHDYAKVEILEGDRQGDIVWYLSNLPELKNGDTVLVESGRAETIVKAKVIRVDYNVNELSFPIPVKKMKYIIGKDNLEN